MCGITTLVSKNLTIRQLSEYGDTLMEQEPRGGDSVGVYLFTPQYQKNIYTLSSSPSEVLKKLYMEIFNKNLLNSPIVLLGHTRACATGSNKDYHPAISKNKKVISIHNGVVSDDYGSYYHLNDTYHLVNVLDYEVKSKRDLRGLKERFYTSGSTIFNINLKNMTLDFLRVGYTPLLFKKEADYELYCSITDKSGFITHKKGFYKLNLKTLFDNKKIIIKKGVKYISTYEGVYFYDKDTYKLVNGVSESKKEYFKEGSGCNLHKGLECVGCLECLDNRLECVYYTGKCLQCGECVFNEKKLNHKLDELFRD